LLFIPGTIDMEELAEAVEEMAQKKSQLKMYRWAVGLLVSKGVAGAPLTCQLSCLHTCIPAQLTPEGHSSGTPAFFKRAGAHAGESTQSLQ
jgi:hypothetical protein